MPSHNLPQRALLSPDPVLPSTSEHQRRRSSSASAHNMEELSPTRTVTIEQHCVGMAESTTAVSRAHPLHHRQSASTPDSMSVAKSMRDNVPVPGPCANRFLPPAPVRIGTNDLPGPPSGGKRRGLSSHDHHQEATSEIKSRVGPDKNHKEAPLVTATSSRSSSPLPSIPPLMDLNFKRQIPREQSLGMPIDPGSRSSSTSPTVGSFVVPRRGAFPPPLSHSEKNALPFSSFFETDSPRPTVGVSDSYLSSGQKASPRTKKIAIRSSESSDTLHPDIDADSDNEGGLVIDESFVSQNGSEASPEKNKSSHKHEKSSNIDGSVSSSITLLSDVEPPSSPDCEILSISTVDSIPSSSHHHKTVSSSDAEHRATPESTTSSKSSVLASISARHRSIMPASQRARKLASSVIGTKLVEKLVEGDKMEQDLLRRFFKAVVMVTERLKWKYKNGSATPTFLSYYKTVFHGFVTSTLCKRENVPSDLYKQELKALQAKCGPYISKWKEQLQRYILRAGTLPKDKTDLEPFMKNKKALMKHVSANNVVELPKASDSDSDGPLDSLKAKSHPPAPPTDTVWHKACPSSDSDRPTDPRKAKALPLPLSTLSAKALQPSAFTPVTSTSSPSSNLASPPSKSTISTTVLTTSPKKPITLLYGQSIHADELNTDSYTFKPLTLSESDQRDASLFTEDRSADYSLDPELDRAPSGFSSHSSSSLPSTDSMVVIDLVGENLQNSCTCLPQMTGSLTDEEQSLTGEKVTVNVVLSRSKESGETTPTVTDQPGPSKGNVTSEKASPDKISPTDSGIKDDLGSNKSSNKLDAVTETKANNVNLTTTSESCDSSTEAEDGEIISSSPSPAPSPPPEKQATSPVLQMAYRDPVTWRGLNSQERELSLSRQRHRHLSHRSSRSRSSSPGARRRGSSPERFYRRRPSRYRSRSRSWSRDRMSRSHDRRRRSMSRDRRTRSRDRRSRDRRYHRSSSRSRGKSRSPVRRLRSQKSNAEKSQRRASRSDRQKDGKGSVDSEDELEILKREALASMKQTTFGNTVKSSAQEEHSRDGVENDDYSERGEVDMDLCSQSSEGAEEEEGQGEADMELCSESAGEGGAEGESADGDRGEAGKMEKGYENSQGSVLGDREGSSVIGGSSTVEMTFSNLINAANVWSEAGWNMQTSKLELSKEDLIVDYDVETSQEECSEADTLPSQAEKEKTEDQSSSGHQSVEQPTPCIPAQAAPVGRSMSAPGGTLGDKSPTHTMGSPMMKQSLPATMTGQLSVTSAELSTQSSLATTSSQSSAFKTSQPSATKVSQPSATKNSQPSAIAEKPPSVVAIARSKSYDVTARPSVVGVTQPSLSKASTGKTNQPPTASKAGTASSVAANSHQTGAATKARQPSTAKPTQVKMSQATSVKASQPSAKASQASSVKTTQTLVKATSAKATQVSKSSLTAQAKAGQLPTGQKAGQAAVVKTSQASVFKTAPSSQASVAKASQPSLPTSIAAAGSKVADPAAIKSLKRSLSRSSSRSGSKANSPCLSPTHASSPSGSNDSLGVGGTVGGASSNDVRVRHRSGSCVKVCVLYNRYTCVCVLE